MRVIFCRTNSIAGFFIRLFTMSKYNHVALEFNGRVIDSNTGVGVSECNLPEFNKRYSKTTMIKVKGVNETIAWRFIMDQVGKSYDYTAIIAFPFRSNWQDEDKYFCSELVASALNHGGKSLRLPANRVTPHNLWMAI